MRSARRTALYLGIPAAITAAVLHSRGHAAWHLPLLIAAAMFAVVAVATSLAPPDPPPMRRTR